MKVNKVYAEEIAKWDGDKATKPFRVLWDDPESGADLKVVYRTPKIGGTIIVALGIAAVAEMLHRMSLKIPSRVWR